MAHALPRPNAWVWFLAWGLFSPLAIYVMKGVLGFSFWPQVGTYSILLFIFLFVFLRPRRSGT